MEDIRVNERLPVQTFLAEVAARSGLSEEQAKAFFQAQAEVAYVHARARTSVPIPGIGVLVAVDRPARDMVMQFGADVGKVRTIPAVTRLKCLTTLAAKEAVFNSSYAPKNVFTLDPFRYDESDPTTQT